MKDGPLLNLTLAELSAVKPKIVRKLAVIPFDINGRATTTLDLLFRTAEGPNAQNETTLALRLHPDHLDLFDHMWRTMYARAKNGPGPKPDETTH